MELLLRISIAIRKEIIFPKFEIKKRLKKHRMREFYPPPYPFTVHLSVKFHFKYLLGSILPMRRVSSLRSSFTLSTLRILITGDDLGHVPFLIHWMQWEMQCLNKISICSLEEESIHCRNSSPAKSVTCWAFQFVGRFLQGGNYNIITLR